MVSTQSKLTTFSTIARRGAEQAQAVSQQSSTVAFQDAIEFSFGALSRATSRSTSDDSISKETLGRIYRRAEHYVDVLDSQKRIGEAAAIKATEGFGYLVALGALGATSDNSSAGQMATAALEKVGVNQHAAQGAILAILDMELGPVNQNLALAASYDPTKSRTALEMVARDLSPEKELLNMAHRSGYLEKPEARLGMVHRMALNMGPDPNVRAIAEMTADFSKPGIAKGVGLVLGGDGGSLGDISMGETAQSILTESEGKDSEAGIVAGGWKALRVMAGVRKDFLSCRILDSALIDSAYDHSAGQEALRGLVHRSKDH